MPIPWLGRQQQGAAEFLELAVRGGKCPLLEFGDGRESIDRTLLDFDAEHGRVGFIASLAA